MPSPAAQPAPAPAPQSNGPDAFKALIVAKYPNGVATDGTKYADMSAQALTQKIVSKYPNGVTNDGRKYADFLTPPTPPQTAPGPLGSTTTFDQPSYFDQVKSAFQGGVGQAQAASQAPNTNILQGARNALSAGAGIVSALTSPVAPLFNATLGKAVETAGKGYQTLPAVQQFSQSPASDVVRQGATDLANAGTVAGGILGGRAALAKAPAVVGAIKNALTPSGTLSDSALNNYYTKAVKPTISGKTTAADTAAYQVKTAQAVNTIAQNKPNLSFVTEDGTKETDRLPQTLSEFSQAIEQTKKTVYSQYDALAQQAGDQGVKVNTTSFTKDLQGVITNKALQLSHPEAVSYAQDMLARYNKTEPIDAATAQQIIENYNAELQSFYRNPSYNQASHVAIDAALVRNLRASLDKAITESTGTQYQALRNQYGGLKTIEADVTKAANRAARLNNKGLADYTDIFSGGDIAAGILTLNPALFAKGIAQHGIKTWFKSLNSPDRAISKMFSGVDQAKSSNTSLPTKYPTATPPAMIKNNPISKTVAQPGKSATPSSLSTPSPSPKSSILEKAKGAFQTIKTQGKRGFIKLPDTSKSVSPETVAKKAGILDIFRIKDYLANHRDPAMAVHAEDKAAPLMKLMGISKLSPELQKQFLTEVVTEFDKTQGRHPLSQRYLRK